MLLTRLFDDRMQRNQRAGKISFYIRSLGEEACRSRSAWRCAPATCCSVVSHQGLQIARGIALVDLMCQLLSNTRDMCKGRQLPVMYHSKAGNIFSISGNLATQFPQAVGWAMAAAIKGEDHLAASWIGEGSSAEADFHHALLFASVYQAPVILNVVNNQWAISTFQGYAAASSARSRRAVRGMASRAFASTATTFSRVCRNAVGGRAGAHRRRPDVDRIGDVSRGRTFHQRRSARYRAKNDHEHWPLGDPIQRLKLHLIVWASGRKARHQALTAELEALVASSWKQATPSAR